MTKKTFETMRKAVDSNNMFDWIANNQQNLTKYEMTLIAKELAYAMQQPLSPMESHSTHYCNETFLNNIVDFYETFGWDDEEEE